MRISDWSSDVCSSDLGVRYGARSANERSVVLNAPVPGGNLGAPDEAEAVKVSDTGLPADYVTLGPVAPDLNGGARFYVPNPDFLLSESGLDAARAYFGLPPGQPDFDPGREFDATENTLAAYVQGKYAVDLSSGISLDGVVGVRYKIGRAHD